MVDEPKAEQERRRFLRLDLSEDVRAVDTTGREIGRVERVGAGGMQIRLPEGLSITDYAKGSQFDLHVIEPGDSQQSFKVEVRVCSGDLLGVQFLN